MTRPLRRRGYLLSSLEVVIGRRYWTRISGEWARVVVLCEEKRRPSGLRVFAIDRVPYINRALKPRSFVELRTVRP